MLTLLHPIDSETLEKFVLGHLTPGEEAELEEHLLVCERCRDALAETELEVFSMKAALRELLSEG